MSQVDEHSLREAIRERSGAAHVPPVPVDALLAGGRTAVRRRRNRFVAGVGLAASVLLVGGVLVLQPHAPKSIGPVDRTPTPTPTEQLRLLRDVPQGALPAVPFAQKDTLYINGGTLQTTRRLDLAVGGDATVVAWTIPTKDGQAAPIDLLDPSTGEPTRRIADDGGRPTVSVDGRLIAWEDDNADGTARVRVWDVENEAALDPISFPFTPSCCDNPFVLIGVDADGAVYARGGATTWVASPGEDPRVVDGLGGADGASVREVGVHRLVVADGSTSRVGHLDGTRFRSEFRVPGLEATLSSDEARVAYVDDDHAVQVRDVASGDELEMRLPTNVVVNGLLTWETSDDLLVQVQAESGDDDAWLRCSAETAKCELATTFRNELPTLPHR